MSLGGSSQAPHRQINTNEKQALTSPQARPSNEARFVYSFLVIYSCDSCMMAPSPTLWLCPSLC